MQGKIVQLSPRETFELGLDQLPFRLHRFYLGRFVSCPHYCILSSIALFCIGVVISQVWKKQTNSGTYAQWPAGQA